MPDNERQDPPYLQVAGHIREQIMSGELREGDRVPPARAISVEWGIAVATATKALNVLRQDGLIVGRAGAGTVVAAQGSLHRTARDWALAVNRTGKIYPEGYYARILSSELVASPEHVALALGGIAVGAPTIRRRRTTYDPNDHPISTSLSWFDGALSAACPALLVTERIPQGTPGYIHQQTGRSVVAGYDQHAADEAAPEEAVQLQIQPGSAVLRTKSRWVDEQGAVIEYGESVSRKLRWTFYEYAVTNKKGDK